MRNRMFALAGVWLLVCAPRVEGVELASIREHEVCGRYEQCIEAAAEGLRSDPKSEALHILKAEAELALGRFDEVRQTIEAGLAQCPASVRLRLLKHRCLFERGEIPQGHELLQQIDRMARQTPWRYTAAEDLVALGEAALMSGADPRQVLREFFERARKESPGSREAWLACGELMLQLHGPDRGVRLYHEGLERFAGDPDLHLGLARALAPADPAASEANVRKALEKNPRHVPALLFDADRAISVERWGEAETLLERVLEVNAQEPEAWAFRAVLAHLRNDPERAAECRKAALREGARNPTIDHLIGLKLSQQYRFREAAECQRRALAIDPMFVPARIQLSQDLLRLGDEAEAWKLVEEARRQAAGHPAVMNLLELRERIARFRTLEDERFVVRMDAREADIYGERVLALLNRAHARLTEKYETELGEKIIVEIFPDEEDFAVRSFGMPSPEGYLAVCFGRVITAGSPAARADEPVNWEAILWHEFCHSVTLDLTNHRMPRWLSEGISVYEEQQENPAWGQRMTPQFRRMILEGKLVPVARMGAAFAAPEGPEQVPFAYFEGSLFVEFMVETYGFEALRSVLEDLGAGLAFEAALQRRTEPLAKIEESFAAFTRRRAEETGSQADWEQADLGALLAGDGAALEKWLKKHPNNLMGLHALARHLLARDEFGRAKEPLRQLVALVPGQVGPSSAYALLAEVHRELGEPAEERRVLRELAERDGSALPMFLRLMELDLAAEDWEGALSTAERVLAVNPLVPEPYRAIVQAAEMLQREERVKVARRVLERIEAGDVAESSRRPVRSAGFERTNVTRQ